MAYRAAPSFAVSRSTNLAATRRTATGTSPCASWVSRRKCKMLLWNRFRQVRTMHPLRHRLEEFVIGNYTTPVHMDERIGGNLKQRRTSGPSFRGTTGGLSSERSDYYLHRTGFTTLYRATAAGRLKEVFLDNEKLHLAKTTSGPSCASDFGFDNYGVFYHWTPDVWAADLYASYCKRTVNSQYDVCVVKMVVRSWDAMVEGATWTLEYGEEWRQLVWHARNRQQYTGEIGRKHRKTDVFIGPMSCDATKVFNAMGTWESVTEQNVFRYGDHGEVAIQHVFHMPDVMSALDDKVQVDLFRCYPENKWLPDPKTWIAGR
ncbi:hypothetical protein EKO04_004069 [Ascochyta lentis]|uniref:Uncharacterized protein n=1 Tax=Ascochyta lentis TaxID=205686 RepID=A0A8H7J3J9_9PLEO|nr:hypothetical protein EKO04_004069 [Ascochyta lentis]